jgi:hypothetical protein
VPPITNRINDNTAAIGCQNIVKSWLKQCSDHDAHEAQRQPFLPTRLLDLGNLKDNGKLQLILSQDIDQTTPYVTLSHCWGGEVPIRLTDKTIDELMAGYELQNMPETFQDAIAVAQWVDSRCSYPILTLDHVP